jgi:hypothetical protein
MESTDNYKTHNSNMMMEFCKKKDKFDIDTMSLALSHFYDGGSLFKRRSRSIWRPIMQTIYYRPTLNSLLDMNRFEKNMIDESREGA